MRIGIFGGSFDPIHLGHIELALEVIECGAADKVVFIPAAKQPFKLDRKMADCHDRLNMVRIAIEGYENLEASSYEIDRADEISYTVNTLNAMQEEYGPGNEIALIQGADTFLQIHKWTRPEEIMKKFVLIVGVRPGYKEEEIAAQEVFLKDNFNARIVRVDNPCVDISSTEIRDEILAEKSIIACEGCANKIPEKVKEYIIEKGLYN